MSSPDRTPSHRTLEVAPDATREEITQSYQLLRRIHGESAGLAIVPSMDEFSPESRAQVLEEIEAAYAELKAVPAVEAAPAPEPDADPAQASRLRRARLEAGLTLEQVAKETCVRKDYLQALEEERFQDLHLAAVNVRGYLVAYATAVGLAPEPVLAAYAKRF